MDSRNRGPMLHIDVQQKVFDRLDKNIPKRMRTEVLRQLLEQFSLVLEADPNQAVLDLMNRTVRVELVRKDSACVRRLEEKPGRDGA